jgi:inositol hexakisphosphate/diphosphoinositol-pentakisphosphate kinase
VPSFTRKSYQPYASADRTDQPDSVKLPKSFVAIDLSQDSNGDRRSNGKNKENSDAKSEDGEKGRLEEWQDEIKVPVADDMANVASPVSVLDLEERRDGIQPAGLPPPVLD